MTPRNATTYSTKLKTSSDATTCADMSANNLPSLTGFTGDSVSPLGATTIPVTFGGEPKLKTLMVSFMVVKLPSTDNAIIGRPTLNRLKAIISTYHRILKFPTRVGVGEVRSDPRESRQCYLTATTLSKKSRTQPAAT
ncbi:hypothetical protein BHM03_00013886, partial [Ensete ventricosum]